MGGVSTWFMCKLCRGETFPNLDLFIEHKRSSHLTRFQNIKRIVFEEKTMYLDDEDCSSSTTTTSSSGNSNYEDALDHVSVPAVPEAPLNCCLAIDYDVPCNLPAERPSTEDKNQEMVVGSKINSKKYSHHDQQATHIDIDIDAGMDISEREINMRIPVTVTSGIKSPSRFNPYVSLKRLSSKDIQTYWSGRLSVKDSNTTSVSSSTTTQTQQRQESKIRRFSTRTPKPVPVDTPMRRKLRSAIIKDSHEGSRSAMDDEIQLNNAAGVHAKSRSVPRLTVTPVIYSHPIVLLKRLTSREIEDASRGRLIAVSIALP